jgi:hypothetical protein
MPAFEHTRTASRLGGSELCARTGAIIAIAI